MRILLTLLMIPAAATADLVSYLDLPEGDTSFTVPGGLTLETSAPVSTGSSYFGITGGTNSFAIDDEDGLEPSDESLTFRFAPGVGLQSMAVKWTRGTVRISGFQSDPAAGTGLYDAPTGTWSHDQAWTSGNTVQYTFANPAASDGQVLTLSVLDPAQNAPQVAVVWIAYGPATATGTVEAVFLDGTKPGQTMAYFGASGYWTLDPIQGWPEHLREQVANRLFSEAGGIGLSSFRFDFGGGDTGTGNQVYQPWTWRFPEAMQPDPAGPIDWTKRAGQQWFLRRAAGYGVTHLTLGANSPPAWATRNGRTYPDATVGTSNLDHAKAPDYAAYLCDIVEHFQTQDGILIDEISPINEPEWTWEGGNQEGNRYTAADAKVVIEALHDELVTRGMDGDTGIFVGDHGMLTSLLDDAVHQQYNGSTFNQNGYGKYREYLADLYADPDLTGKFTPVIGYHSYWTDPEPVLASDLRDLFRTNCEAHGFGRRQTEFAILGSDGPGRDLSLEPALRVCKVIHKDLTHAGADGWSWWLALSPHDYKDGLLYTNYDWIGKPDPELYDSKLLWMLGHFSRFIRPGYRAVNVPGMDDLNGLMASGWIAPDDKTAVTVLANASDQARTVRPAAAIPGAGPVREWTPWTTDAGRNLERGTSFSGDHVLPPRSITTLVGHVSPGPFRLRATISAGNAFLPAGGSTTLQADATWEDGVVRIFAGDGTEPLQLAGHAEWVLIPLDRAPRGRLFAGRYHIATTDGTAFLSDGEEAPQVSETPVAWHIDRDADGRQRLTSEASGLVLAREIGAVTLSRDREGDAQRVRLEPQSRPATFTWADGLGTSPSLAVSPLATRWYQVTAEMDGVQARARILVRVGEPPATLGNLPAGPVVIRPGEPVTLNLQRREDGVTHRFQILPADRALVIGAGTPGGGESPVQLATPGGGGHETWEWIDPGTGAAAPWVEPGTTGYLRNTATGAGLRPEDGNSTAGTPVVLSPLTDAAAEWICETAEHGRYRIVHATSGTVLGISPATDLPILADPTGTERFSLNTITGRPAGIRWSHAGHDARSATVYPASSTLLEVRTTTGGVDLEAAIPVRVLLDFETWSERRFGEVVAHHAHHDGDPLDALEEFLHGTDPLRRDDLSLVRSARSHANGSWEILLRRNIDADGTWTVQTSTDLANWRDLGPGEFSTDGPKVLIPVPSADPGGFYRLKFTFAD